jgi:hypothetical protein
MTTANNFDTSISLIFPNTEEGTQEKLIDLSHSVLEYNFELPDDDFEDEDIDDQEDDEDSVFEPVEADDHEDDSLAGHLFLRVLVTKSSLEGIRHLWVASLNDNAVVDIRVQHKNRKDEPLFVHKFLGFLQDPFNSATPFGASKADDAPLTIELAFDLYDCNTYSDSEF